MKKFYRYSLHGINYVAMRMNGLTDDEVKYKIETMREGSIQDFREATQEEVNNFRGRIWKI